MRMRMTSATAPIATVTGALCTRRYADTWQKNLITVLRGRHNHHHLIHEEAKSSDRLRNWPPNHTAGKWQDWNGFQVQAVTVRQETWVHPGPSIL